VVHIFQLIGFRNRLIVMITWAWDYFHYDRALRLIGPELQPQSEKSRLNQTDR
jgi:NADH:ubiquinone reductase (H+-translocating)